MNIAIVDDRKTDSDRLVGFIDTYAEQHRLQWGAMDRFSSGEEFLGAFTAGKYDLIFLDIYMDGITGMETARRIRRADHGCRIIFITTSPEFAVESYDVSASFYLLKPIEKNGVFAALDRCGLQVLNAPGRWRLQHILERQFSRSTISPTPNMSDGRFSYTLRTGRIWKSP